MKKITAISVFAFLVSMWSLSAQTYNIKDFKAMADGKTINTEAIQSAIDNCFEGGGGEVIVPPGVFYTGTIFLKSNVYLHLMPGAVLQGSYNPADYPEHNILSHKKFGTITHDGQWVKYMKALVIADNVQNIGIIGQGTIKGAGEGDAFQLGLNKDGKPKNIFFVGCTNVKLKDITVLNSAQVTISISKCEKVFIDGLYVNSQVNWNCDGMDVDSKDVTIANCIIESEDDALCFKSEYLNTFCENITVTNCVVSSMCNGIKLGTGSRTGFRNITVNNCVIKRNLKNEYFHWEMTPDVVLDHKTTSVNTGIVIMTVDGGLMENISFSDIVMTDVLSPIFIRVGSRFLTPDNKPSVMRNISISNVTAHTRSILPSVIAGLQESPAHDIHLSNISIYNHINVSPKMLKTFPVEVFEDLKTYPENRLTFGLKIPAAAFYVRHVEGITMNDILVTYGKEEARSAFYFDDTRNIRLRNVLVNNQKVGKNKALIGSKNSDKVEFEE
ncbi:MAG: glycosyl hydrolase family 28 protein [Salinivirgaceae bacterium]|jgi:polygalacturonase|nr:glycosyl hydrolase family 28 protein [Salinivirgaceae bacterium]